MTNKALLVGINYPNTPNELRGCVNDVIAIRKMLIANFKFDAANIVTLTDKQATTANIKQNLELLVADLQPGDTVFFHYSGHGSQMYNNDKSDIENDNLDEIL